MELQQLAFQLFPELLLTIFLVVVLGLELLGGLRNRHVAFGLAALLVLSDCFFVWQAPLTGYFFYQTLTRDLLAIGFQYIFAASALLTLWLAWADEELFQQKLSEELNAAGKKDEGYGEFIFVLLATLLALQLLAMAEQLILIFIALEMVAIGSYILVHFRFRPSAAEASFKYLLFGMTSSGIMLYGMSWWYGLSGGELTLQALAALPYSTMGLIAILLVFAGLLFKLSAVPFHFWTPDVYEGSAASVAAFLAVATKAGGLVVLWRIYALYVATWPFLEASIAVIAIFCFILGNSVALWQENNKRLLAYSSIAQTGFLLIAIIAGKTDVLLFYLWVYLLLSFGAFGLIQGAKAETIRDFSGHGRRLPVFGVTLFILMIGLTGLPPTAGFTAKFWLFAALWKQYDDHFIVLLLLVVAALSAVVSLFYYLKMPYFAFFRHTARPLRISSGILLPATGIAVLIIALLFGY